MGVRLFTVMKPPLRQPWLEESFGFRRRAQPFSCRRFENLTAFSRLISEEIRQEGFFKSLCVIRSG